MYEGYFGEADFTSTFNSRRRQLKSAKPSKLTKDEHKELARLEVFFKSTSSIRSSISKLKKIVKESPNAEAVKSAKKSIEELEKRLNEISQKALRGK